jgi:hypothetical protein
MARLRPVPSIRSKPGYDGGEYCEGPETICDLGAGVPNHSELELRCGVPHRLGGDAEAGGMKWKYALGTHTLRVDGKLLAEKNCKTFADDAIQQVR